MVRLPGGVQLLGRTRWLVPNLLIRLRHQPNLVQNGADMRAAPTILQSLAASHDAVP